MRTYQVKLVHELNVNRVPLKEEHYLMSPFVWIENGHHRMALRVVEVTETGGWGPSRIYFAEGDGDNFEIMPIPALAPGPWAEDQGGCEDPTVFFHEGECRVYYTGWNEHIRQSKLLYAHGPDISNLKKRGDVFPKLPHWNTKEATLAQAGDKWWLFYEYSEIRHSKIGRAWADEPTEKWQPAADPFGLREGRWDGYHLSTGPICLRDSDRPVMFYNGADADARWRIGWVEFDPDYEEVVRRSEQPMLAPENLPEGYNDIAFASSVLQIEEDVLELYYSVGDRQLFKGIIEIGASRSGQTTSKPEIKSRSHAFLTHGPD